MPEPPDKTEGGKEDPELLRKYHIAFNALISISLLRRECAVAVEKAREALQECIDVDGDDDHNP